MAVIPHVRLIRSVNAPTGRGPGNGMFALQRALRAVQPDWLHIGGALRRDEMPWFWCWQDRTAACACAAAGVPFVMGPNMLFADCTAPGRIAGERELCNAGSCRLQFTESAWYRELILVQSGPAMRAPVVLWPYPIDPLPDEPQPATNSLLIYEKTKLDRATLCRLLRRWPASVLVRYGKFEREEMIDLARRSKACLYVSHDDRGPLALAEILLSGCPAVGVPRGAPWIEAGRMGFCISEFDSPVLLDAIEKAMQLDRGAVRAAACERFDVNAIVQTILAALDAARC